MFRLLTIADGNIPVACSLAALRSHLAYLTSLGYWEIMAHKVLNIRSEK